MFVEFNTLVLLWPEAVLIGLATWIYIFGGTVRPSSRFWWSMFAAAGYLVAFFALAQQDALLLNTWKYGEISPSGPLALDYLGHGLRWLAVFVGLVITLIVSRLADRGLAAEVLGTIMLATAGVMLAARANDLVFLFVSLELVSIPIYILLFIGRRDRASAESAVKYFFLSILSSALLLYGFSFLYGIAGTTTIAGTQTHHGIREVLQSGAHSGLSSLLAPVAIVLVFAGLGFKLAAVPFHFYAPDVFQGTTNANAALLAAAPKIAAVAALVRLLAVGFPIDSDLGWRLAMVLAVLTMTIGNICALWQTNIRRLLAYSSIAHAGYMLIGLAVAMAAVRYGIADSGGVMATLFYLLAYVVTSLAVFAALAYLGSQQRQVNSVDELAGLGRTRPLAGAVIAACMFSFAGVPPLAGFWGKFALFTSAVKLASHGETAGMSYWFAVLAVIGAINAAIGAAYYLRVVSVMYFQPSAAPLPARGGIGAAAATLLSATLMIALGLAPGSAMSKARLAEKTALERSAAATRLSAAPRDDGEVVSGGQVKLSNR